VYTSLFMVFDRPLLDYQMRAYLKHQPAPGFPYPLSKMVLARSLLAHSHPSASWVHATVGGLVAYDPVYSAQMA
jgi:hypothetical protein